MGSRVGIGEIHFKSSNVQLSRLSGLTTPKMAIFFFFFFFFSFFLGSGWGKGIGLRSETSSIPNQISQLNTSKQ